jgi:hypothetical protein
MVGPSPTPATDQMDGLLRRLGGYLVALLLGRSVAAHLLRGGIGAFVFVWGAVSLTAHPTGAVAAIICALILLRGCPLCWIVSLIDIIHARGISAPRC